MIAVIERPLTPAATRAQIAYDEAVQAEASTIMHYTKEQLEQAGFGTVADNLLKAWNAHRQVDTFEAFVTEVVIRIQTMWHANGDHVAWLASTFETEIQLEEAVKADVHSLLTTPVDELTFIDTDMQLHQSQKLYGAADTYIAYVDKVRRRLVKLRGEHDEWVAWFTSRFPSKG